MNSTSAYQSSGTAALHGRMNLSTVTVGNQATRTTYGYSLSGDVLTQTSTITGFDNRFLTNARSTSVVNDLLLSTRKEDAVTVSFAYDIHGRVLTETISPGTANQARRQYTYAFVAGNARANVVTTDAMGGRYLTRYDGLGREVAIVQLPTNGAERPIREKTYNLLGQLVSDTAIDYLSDSTAGMRMTTRYEYDGWGERVRTVHPDGATEVNEYNPVNRVRRSGLLNSGFSRSVENAFNKATTIAQLSTNDQAHTLLTRTFDGFGRCVSEVDANNHVTRYVYDAFDRIVTQSFTHAGSGTAYRTIANTYAAHAIEALKTSIRVNNVLIGSRNYDGVGRLTSESRGSAAATTYEYDNNSLRPRLMRLPTGIVRTYQYNTQLDAITQINAGNQVSTFALHATTGGLSRAVNSEVTRVLQEDQFGRITTDAQTVGGQTHTNTFSYSMAGRLTRVNSALGDIETRSYDAHGRLSGGHTGTVGSSVTYDGAGRIHTVSASAQGRSYRTTISYDVFGREASRQIHQDSALFQTISLTYDARNKLARRVTTGAAATTVLNNETFSYDPDGRLTEYSCTGPQFPVDQRGRSIRLQRFTFDVFDNVTSVVTTFSDNQLDTSIRAYGGVDPTQLMRITHTNPVQSIVLGYDAAGNLSRDNIRTYNYSDSNQLTTVSAANGTLSSYGYDATGRQCRQTQPGATAVTLHYSADRVIGARQGDATARYVRQGETVLARSLSTIGTELNVSNTAESVTTVVSANNSVRHVQYAPYGMSGIDGDGSGSLLERQRPGFNGERYDPIGQVYHLGNGLRSYSPELMIFLSPDPLSPFGDGGINSYGYCNGDPVNFRDPSGLVPRALAWTMLGLGILATLMFGPAAFAGISSALGIVAVMKAVAFTANIAALTSFTIGLSISAIDQHDNHVALASGFMIAGTVFSAIAGISLIGKSGLMAALQPRTRFTFSNVRATPYDSARSLRYSLTTKRKTSRFTHHFVANLFHRPLKSVVQNGYWTTANLNRHLLGHVFNLAGIGVGAAYAATALSSNPDADESLHVPVIGILDGGLEPLETFSTEFYNMSQQLRNSTIQEFYPNMN